MLLRKINAAISLLITFLLLGHAITVSLWMLSSGAVAISTGILPWALTGLVALHAFISIEILVSDLMNGGSQKCKKYPKKNLATIVQRVSGALMVIFIALHIAGAAKYMTPPKAVHAILPPLFFAIVLAHIAISTSKAFVTLGIGNAKVIKTVDIAIKVICAATLIAAVTGFYLFSV